MPQETEHSPYGQAQIDPAEPVEAGSYTTWTITYTVGELGMDDGSTIMIVFSQTSDMGEPQFTRPIEPNYCTASTTGDAQIEAGFAPRAHIRPMKRAIRLRVHDGFLQPGEKIQVTLGDTEQGSPGIQAQSFPERFIFRVLVDPHATEHFAALPQDLTIDIIPGPAESITAVLPSTAGTGEQKELRVRAEDYWGNIATGFSGTLHIQGDNGIDTPKKIEIENGTGTVPVTPTEPGIHRLEIEGDRFEAVSNPLQCQENIERHTYWGDIHGQSGETVGSGTVHSYFNHLQDAAFLDFGAHAANDFQITDELWHTPFFNSAPLNVHSPCCTVWLPTRLRLSTSWRKAIWCCSRGGSSRWRWCLFPVERRRSRVRRAASTCCSRKKMER